MENKISFPIGYKDFHKKQIFNYQLNRWYSFGFFSYKDSKKAGEMINNFSDWKIVMINMAEEKIAQKDYLSASFFYRAAEFYCLNAKEGKEELYDKFFNLFYKYFDLKNTYIESIPYQNSYLAALRIMNDSEINNGTILMHGGFDSFKEEFIFMARYLSNKGYTVIIFEGPGQGQTLKKYNIPFDYEWEKPVSAILDYYNLDEATLFGISLGGYLCLRAASFEPRIKRVISTGCAYDYFKIPPTPVQWLISFFSKHMRDSSNKGAMKQIEKGGLEAWRNSNIMYITKLKSPMDAFEYAWSMNSENLNAGKITQDVLLITNKNDHFIPFKLHKPLVQSLKNVKSLEDIVFTKADNAENHCSVGNIKLSLDKIVEWLEKII